MQWLPMRSVAHDNAKNDEAGDPRKEERAAEFRKALDTTLTRDLLCPVENEKKEARSNEWWGQHAENLGGMIEQDSEDENSDTDCSSRPEVQEDNSEEEELFVEDEGEEFWEEGYGEDDLQESEGEEGFEEEG